VTTLPGIGNFPSGAYNPELAQYDPVLIPPQQTGWFDFSKIAKNQETNSLGGLAEGAGVFSTFLHEVGHMLGVAHPFDEGNDTDVLPLTTGPVAPDLLGDYNFDQSVFTVMSYRNGYDKHPVISTGKHNSFGYATGLGALDIAAIRQL